MNLKIKIGLYLLSAAFLAVMYAFISDIEESEEVSVWNDSTKMKGLCWVAGDSIAQHNLSQISSLGANWISQTPFGWMSGHDNVKVVLNNERAWWGETDYGVAHTTKLAKEAGVKTMLKPHIWLRRANGKWRSDIAMNSDQEWKQWFESYHNWIMHYALLAEAHGVEALCIGTELYQTTKRFPNEWRKIIADIREVYKGDLTYAANWYKEYEEVTFWDDLDYIGIQAYFPLSDKEKPNKSHLCKKWKKHIKDLERVAKKYNKKIVFTEIGYKNTADAAKEPWTWPQDLNENIKISSETQLVCYESLFESVWEKPWFGGLFIWKWFHSTYRYEEMDDYFNVYDERRKARAKKNNHWNGRLPVYFTPQRSEAINVLKKWYTDEQGSLNQ